MIFYGHRFEDNCCILRVVVQQGDAAASFRGEEGGVGGGMEKLLRFLFPSPPSSPSLSLSLSPHPSLRDSILIKNKSPGSNQLGPLSHLVS